MGTPLDFVIRRETPDWASIVVTCAETGEVLKDVVEADARKGLAITFVRKAGQLLAHKNGGFRLQIRHGPIRIERTDRGGHHDRGLIPRRDDRGADS